MSGAYTEHSSPFIGRLSGTTIPFALAFGVLLAGCGGAGGASGQPVAPNNAPFVAPSGTVPITFTVPTTMTQGVTLSSSSVRGPRYVSPGTASVAVYDGSTLIYVGNVGANATISTVYVKSGQTTVLSGSCSFDSAPTCTLTVQASLGAHTLGIVTYPRMQWSPNTGTPPPWFFGVILAEGEVTTAVVSGTNAAQNIAPRGVADRVLFIPPSLPPQPNGPPAGSVGSSYTVQYAIDDSAEVANGYQIVQPGPYDNGPVTFSEIQAVPSAGVITMAPISQSAPPSVAGLQSFTVTCAKRGTSVIGAVAKTKPNTAYASGLTYTSDNYPPTPGALPPGPPGLIGATVMNCIDRSATASIAVH